ncbi:hypothetical protein V8G54_016171 [Vigna mungo]|uniref:RING-type domain-containing protein n=1 Tax=Vigna mungo TaxID=3915 RepID=A0AAQ3S0V7_VIGMU
MGFYIEDPLSGFTIGQAIYEAALIIALLRCLFCFLTTRERDTTLLLTTFGDIKDRLPQTEDTCAVCLSQLEVEDEVRELMNCYHVFHRECIDRWLEHEHENHNPTCPLCRAPLLSSCCHHYSAACQPPPQPSWAVERLLYLFGDDLLPC